MKTPLIATLAASLILAFTGCRKQEEPAKGEFKPVRQTSFDEVTRQLDSGGSVYAYIATDQWLSGLSTNVTEWAGLLGMMSEVSAGDRANLERAVGSLARVVEQSGVENLTGIGISGIQVTPELSRTKLILHHGRGNGDGVFWSIFGRKPHALGGFDLLPESTAIAAFGDVDVKLLWETIEEEIRRAEVPELTEAMENWPEEFEQATQISWEKFLSSLAGEGGMVLTLNEANRIQVPFTHNMAIPEPGLLLAVKVKDDLIYNRISAEMQKSGMAKMVEEKGAKWTAIRLPIPMAMDLEITVANAGEYLFVASSSALVRQVLEVRSGKTDGLRQTAGFQELLKYVPRDGNHFFYADRRFSGTVQALQKAALANEDAAFVRSQFMQRVFNQKPMVGLVVGRHTDTGWESVMVGSQDSATAIVAAPAIGGVAMAAAVALPAFAKAKEKSKSVACMNNMKQIAIALRIWSKAHDGQFPFQTSQSIGGSKEYREAGPDGYDGASYRHFQVMPNELSSTKVLVCPADDSKSPADSFADLSPENVSYLLRTEASAAISEPKAIMGYCPIHEYVLYVDGSVGRQRK